MAASPDAIILTVNCGSSSLKLAVYEMGASERLIASAHLERIARSGAHIKLRFDQAEPQDIELGSVPDHHAAFETARRHLQQALAGQRIAAVGHRIVHGGPHCWEPTEITPELTAVLSKIAPFAPMHLPQALQVINELRRQWPETPQVACFDTGFHRTLPEQARVFALPRRFAESGIHRYGFHGLSFEFIVEELARVAGAETADGRLIVAHLGNGASMAAIREGRSIDTTMGLTPVGGLIMGTRCGDLDPGVVLFLMSREKMAPADLARMLGSESGLLGISGISPDMRTLLEQAATHATAAQAVTAFCYQARKFLGALTTPLGGLDTLVFTGGIGENAAPVRQEITAGLGYLGIEVDPDRNARHDEVISSPGSRVCVRVMKTNEELMIARHTCRLLSARRSA